ncbi:hypothetical protein GCM10011385_41490 [Nitratireductor aestuarii]|uniref:Uncharacterized protein n=2 Tax=Nitratireductor aestuarii TaxID=1735103 RepID=A0A916S4W9_9HYPH|nr:hypothetical protein GCM10011385_41490 [Nitratireductor aestuarii]
MLKEVVAALASAGMLTVEPYVYKQRTTTVEPTTEFLELLVSYGIRLADVGREAGGETIWLVARTGGPRFYNQPLPKCLVHYEDTEETTRLRHEVATITDMLGGAGVTYDGEAVGPLFLHRSFLVRSPEAPAEFNLNGRLWGGFWQTLDSEKRHRITIGGEGITDLDFAAMHPTMAYLQVTGRPPSGDPYDIPGLEEHRSGAKQAMASLLSRTGPMLSLAPKLKAKLPEGWTARQLVEAISGRHPAIAHLFGTDLGGSLMHMESRILMAVLLELARRGIAALPMHDGIQTKLSDAEEAMEVMQSVSEQMLGVALPVKEKPIWRPSSLANAA